MSHVACCVMACVGAYIIAITWIVSSMHMHMHMQTCVELCVRVLSLMLHDTDTCLCACVLWIDGKRLLVGNVHARDTLRCCMSSLRSYAACSIVVLCADMCSL